VPKGAARPGPPKGKTMTEASRWRLALTKKIALIYSEHPKVRAVVAGGSVACGVADSYSDTDVIVFWTELPSDEEREIAVERIEGKRGKCYTKTEKGMGEYCYVGDAYVDIGHITIKAMEDILSEVLDHHNPDPSKQRKVGGILDAIPFYGKELVEQWQIKAAKYPDGLAQAMVKKHLRFYPCISYPEKVSHQRGDVLFLYESFLSWTKSLMGVLMGLNRLYDRGELKWADRFIGRMQVVPLDFSTRIKRCFQEEPIAAIKQFHSLIEETFRLVEMHMPEIDTKEARELFEFPVNRCDRV
jgi:predicted nucleotidyltransferase